MVSRGDQPARPSKETIQRDQPARPTMETIDHRQKWTDCASSRGVGQGRRPTYDSVDDEESPHGKAGAVTLSGGRQEGGTMLTRSKINLANGVFSVLVLTCGISFSVLVYMFFNKIVTAALNSIYDTRGASAYAAYASSPIWAIGFAFIIPGLIGVIAACAQGKGGYITQMVFCILTLVIMGIIFILCLLIIGTFASQDQQFCTTLLSSCVCSNGGGSSAYTCELLNELNTLGQSIVAMVILGWIFTLVATILGGILACRRERIQPGFVMQPTINATVVHTNTMGHMGQPPPQYTPENLPPSQYQQPPSQYM
ncbi:uncharacterized protein [Haliotis asinina]|uniref:uncharacterized protein n=1 Tax=Haliotis asinina TaxID=109174 RepID=UPI0035318597